MVAVLNFSNKRKQYSEIKIDFSDFDLLKHEIKCLATKLLNIIGQANAWMQWLMKNSIPQSQESVIYVKRSLEPKSILFN